MVLTLGSCSGGGGEASEPQAQATSASGANPRIVNGFVVDQAEFPSIRPLFSLFPDGTPRGLCSGTFISANHYLTAAHCLIDEDGALTGSPGSQIPPSQLVVLLQDGRLVSGAGVATHPAYTGAQEGSSEIPGLVFTRADIGILLVAEGYDGPLPALSTRAPSSGQFTLLTGYGGLSNFTPTDGQLRFGGAAVDLVSAADTSIYWAFNSLDESGTCFGDSGGPQFALFGEGEPSVIVGINSGLIGGCDPISIKANTLVPAYLDFVNLITGGQQAQF